MLFRIETEEIVRAHYWVEANDEAAARQKMMTGDVTKPHVYEATSMEIKEVISAADVSRT